MLYITYFLGMSTPPPRSLLKFLVAVCYLLFGYVYTLPYIEYHTFVLYVTCFLGISTPAVCHLHF